MRSIKNLEKVLLLTLGIGAGTLGCASLPSITYRDDEITIKNEYKGDIQQEIKVPDVCYITRVNPLTGLKNKEEIPCDKFTTNSEDYATNQPIQGQLVPQQQSYCQPTININCKDNQKEPKKTQQEPKPTKQKVVPQVVPPSKTPQEFGSDNFDIF
ncbi:MAG: hypothetical protein QW244_00815 [Candidatus Pacearchaeota archaeon]